VPGRRGIGKIELEVAGEAAPAVEVDAPTLERGFTEGRPWQRVHPDRARFAVEVVAEDHGTALHRGSEARVEIEPRTELGVRRMERRVAA